MKLWKCGLLDHSIDKHSFVHNNLTLRAVTGEELLLADTIARSKAFKILQPEGKKTEYAASISAAAKKAGQSESFGVQVRLNLRTAIAVLNKSNPLLCVSKG